MSRTCDICNKGNLTSYVDGATRMGPWANMCPSCYEKYGVGLGIGRGQLYRLDGDHYVQEKGGSLTGKKFK